MAARRPSLRTGYERAVTRDGLLAGVLGALALTLFFLVLDASQGHPLRTPSALASALFVPTPEAVELRHVVAMFVVQLGVFALVGVGAVRLFRVTRMPENVLLGAAYGLLVLTLLFYAALLLSGVDDVPVPAWPMVMLGNLVAGAVMGAYLQRVGALPGHREALDLVKEHPVMREGIVTGLLGAAVVALWFLLADLVGGAPFRTFGTLGSILFRGAEGAGAVVVSASMVLGYSTVHLLAFLVLGVVLAGAVTGLEKYPGLVAAIALFFVFLGVVFVAVVVVMGTWVLEGLVVQVLVGNALATVVMGAYLWRAHSVMRAEIRMGALWRNL